MDTEVIQLLIVALATVLVVLSGVPIAYGLSLLCLAVTIFIVGSERIELLGNVAYGEVGNFALVAVPLFILTAHLISHAGVSEGAFEVVARRFRRIRGNLGVATNFLSTLFAAIIGSSPGNTAIMALVALEPMRRRGYDMRLASGTIVAGGALGALIPPSTMLVLYGVITEQSVGELMIAALVPGLTMSAFMTLYIIMVATRHPEMVGDGHDRETRATDEVPAGHTDPSSPVGSTGAGSAAVGVASRLEVALRPVPTLTGWRSAWSDARTVAPIIALLAFMVWGVYAGVATTTEIAGLGAAAAVFLMFYYHRFTFSGFQRALFDTARVTSMILLIVVMASYLGRLFAFMGVGPRLVGFVADLGWSRLAVASVICVFLLVLGALLDEAAIVLVIGPLAHTLMLSLGADPIWWGVVFVMMMEIGLIAPPVGINLFVLKSIATDLPMTTIMRGAVPFVAVQLVAVVVCLLFPTLVLWLPNQM